MRSSLLLLGSLVALAAACRGSAPTHEEPKPPITQQVSKLSPERRLVRISMVLRGRRPAIGDLQRVHDDPKALESIVDSYLSGPELGETIRELHDAALFSRVAPSIYPAGFPVRDKLSGSTLQEINTPIVEAPLRLIEHVVTRDRPYTEIVTADYTIANGTVAKVWGLPHSGAENAWEETRNTDGRAHAGILSDSWLFTRHATTYSNANRGRANAMSRALLCFDFLQRDIQVDASINLADPAEVANAVKVNATCSSCHQALDPLAAYFGAYHPLYVPADQVETYPFRFYLPSLSKIFTSATPAYFGQKSEGIASLGKMVADDPRFSLCAARRHYAYFHQVPLERVPFDQAAKLQKVLVDSGMKAKALMRAIVLDESFERVGGDGDDAASGYLKIRPSELARAIEDLTGFRWTTDLRFDFGAGPLGPIDLLRDPLFGFEVLGGGIDGQAVTVPSHTMNPSSALVLRAVAAQAAAHVVSKDFGTADKASRKLLQRVDASTKDEATLRAQLVDLHLRLYGETVTDQDESVTDALQIFREAEPLSGVERAWQTTLFAMLQDARFAYY